MTKKILYILPAASLLLLLLMSVCIRAAQTPQRVPIELKWADVMGFVGAEGIRNFSGHVKFIQGDVVATCDEAIQYTETNRVSLKGNVVITQQNLVLSAPLINYDGDSRIADAFQGVKITDRKSVLTADKGTYSTQSLIADFKNNVKIEDDSALIWADRIIYQKSSRNSSAFGNVLIQGKFTNALLGSDTLYHYPGIQYTKVWGMPVLYQIDTVEALKIRTTSKNTELRDSISGYYNYFVFDTLSVSSDTMEAFRHPGEESYRFTNNVEITRGSIAAVASNAVYNKTGETITLINTPIVWYDSTQLHGDSIVINIPNRKLSLIHSIGNALAESRDNTLDLAKINQVFSNEIFITFANDSINGINGYGNSKSLYFYISDEGEEGASRVGCDTILIDFRDGQADNIIWLGAVQGEYIPHTMLGASPREYYLPYFSWSDNRPVKKLVKQRVAQNKNSDK